MSHYEDMQLAVFKSGKKSFRPFVACCDFCEQEIHLYFNGRITACMECIDEAIREVTEDPDNYGLEQAP